MYGAARKSEKGIYQEIRTREEEIRHGIPRQDTCQPGMHLTGGDSTLRAHPLQESYRARLVSNGRAIIVSLPHLEEQAASVVATHFHIHPTEPEHWHIWVKLELVAAFCPAVVLEFESVSVKERALAQLQYQSRFNFLEERGVQLEAYTLREDIAREPTFILGSRPLKSLALLHESLRAFFWYKGYVSTRDLVTEQLNGQIKRNVMIKNNRGFPWVQKCTVVKGGNGDQEIPAEPVEECSICLHSGPRQPLHLENDRNNDWKDLRQVPDFPEVLRTASASKTLIQAQTSETQSPLSTTSKLPVIAPANTTANRNDILKRSAPTHPQRSSTNAYRTPARARNAIMSAKAPNRKVMFLKYRSKAHANCSGQRTFSPDAPELYQRRPRLQGP